MRARRLSRRLGSSALENQYPFRHRLMVPAIGLFMGLPPCFLLCSLPGPLSRPMGMAA